MHFICLFGFPADSAANRFEPAVDVSRLGLAGIAMTAWCVFWLARAIRALARKK
jgi:hypothetical protein